MTIESAQHNVMFIIEVDAYVNIPDLIIIYCAYALRNCTWDQQMA